MARVEPVQSGDASAEAAAMLAGLQERRGYVPNLYATLAHSPELLQAFMGVVEATRVGTVLDARLREFAILAIAKDTGATIQWLSHLPLAKAVGATDAQMVSLGAWEGSPEFVGVDRAVLQFASEVGRLGAASDETWFAATALLGEREMVELSFVCAFYSGVSRFLRTTGVDVDEAYVAEALASR